MNYYISLGVSKDASEYEIANAYDNLTEKYQGDIEKTLEISVAYNTLLDPEQRVIHDIENGILRPQRVSFDKNPVIVNTYAAVGAATSILSSAFINFFISFFLMSVVATVFFAFI